MRLYLDEDLASRELERALRKAGHDIVTARGGGNLGHSDALQLIAAIRDGRVCITRNRSDFEQLHDLVIVSGGSHPGILTIHKDNDRRRDIKTGQIVTAIQNIESVVSSLRNLLLSINEWR
jgi:predicted nuclease of predicted toxin-antitoxin system